MIFFTYIYSLQFKHVIYLSYLHVSVQTSSAKRKRNVEILFIINKLNIYVKPVTHKNDMIKYHF